MDFSRGVYPFNYIIGYIDYLWNVVGDFPIFDFGFNLRQAVIAIWVFNAILIIISKIFGSGNNNNNQGGAK